MFVIIQLLREHARVRAALFACHFGNVIAGGMLPERMAAPLHPGSGVKSLSKFPCQGVKEASIKEF
jgi:hypothetical protein